MRSPHIRAGERVARGNIRESAEIRRPVGDRACDRPRCLAEGTPAGMDGGPVRVRLRPSPPATPGGDGQNYASSRMSRAGIEWILFGMATKSDVMVTLVSAFGVFSAFGAAILAFFTAGGGLQRISSSLVFREQDKIKHGNMRAHRRLLLQGEALVWLIASVVAVTVIINGIGLFTSFFWLVASGNGDAHDPSWAYVCAEVMFYIEAVVISVITVIAVVGSALVALPNSRATTS